MPLVLVADITDPRLDDYRNVPDPDLLSDRGLFVAEGRHVVRRLLTESRFATRSLLLTPAAHGGLAHVLNAFPNLPVFIVSPEAMNAITGFNIHRGCLAIGERPPRPAWQRVVRDARLAVVLEHVSNADNVGGIFRNAAAFGVEAVLLGPSCTDPLYRKAIRTSIGAALRIPFAMLEDWPADLQRLRAVGFRLLALTPSPAAVPVADAIHDVRRGRLEPTHAAERVALLLGHEGEGLSAAAISIADARVRIPMADNVDSLNVASAAAVALYELART